MKNVLYADNMGVFKLTDPIFNEDQVESMEESRKAAAARMRKHRQKAKVEQGRMDLDRRKKENRVKNRVRNSNPMSQYHEDMEIQVEVHDEVVEDNYNRKMESDRVVQAACEEILRQLLGEDKVHLHFISKNPQYTARLLDLEKKSEDPLDCETLAFKALGTLWFRGPGMHIFLDSEDKNIVLIMRDRAFVDIESHHRNRIEKCLKTIMDWTFAVPEIKNNRSHANVLSGTGEQSVTRLRHGNMFALGWHASMERGKKVVWYAPASSQRGYQQYADLDERQIADVALLYRDGFSTLFPGGFKKLRDYAQKNEILGFAQMEPNDLDESVFANSLIITRNDFANYQHNDNDAVPVAYGMWWVGVLNENTQRYVLSESCGHDKIRGGAFLLGGYGIAIEFEKCQGLVEIAWRGTTDLHATMLSHSEPGTTRFGTSVQISKSTVRNVRSWREGDSSKLSKIITYYDRL